MIKAKLILPKMETHTVWAGMYGGHYDVIVFFHNKPVRSNRENSDMVTLFSEKGEKVEVYPYSPYENKKEVIGAMWLADFFEYFPESVEQLKPYLQNGRPRAIEIPEVFKIELTTIFDPRGNMIGMDTGADGYSGNL